MNRKRRSIDNYVCPYGSSCLRKNTAHRMRYHWKKSRRHESEEENSEIPQPKWIQPKWTQPKWTLKNPFPAEDQYTADYIKKLEEEYSAKPMEKNSEKPQNEARITRPKRTLKNPFLAEEQNTSDSSKKLALTDKKSSKDKLPISKTLETVEDVLKSMPPDFFDLWEFCKMVNETRPADAFLEVGMQLVGVYDLLSKEMPKDKKVAMHTHWRFYYDPPEFQTVVKTEDEDLYHIGYFRDDPAEFPKIVAANRARDGPHLTLKGDNILTAINTELIRRISRFDDSKQSSCEISNIQKRLRRYTEEKGYCFTINSPKIKERKKSVVCSTFHGLGIVVPVINGVGYRPLPETNRKINAILQNIVGAVSEEEKLLRQEALDELVTLVNFANDEADFGMGLELGIDLFCFGNSEFHSQCLNLLTVAYRLLKREKYIEILTAHLANRSNCGELYDSFKNLSITQQNIM